MLKNTVIEGTSQVIGMLNSKEVEEYFFSDLLRASLRADEQIRMKNQIEQDISTNEEDIDELESQLKEAKTILGESERKVL